MENPIAPAGGAAPPPEALPENRPAYDGTARGIGRIALVNVVLSLLTLGIYRFWARTRLRRYVWNRIAFLGDRLEYTGRPAELLIGFLIAIAILIPISALYTALQFYAATWGGMVQNGLDMAYSVLFIFLFHLAVFRARRYRLSRTAWRGIRGGQSGSSARYGLMGLGQTAATALSLGLAYPWMTTTLQRYRTANTWIGDRQLSFEGRTRDLMGRWLVCWLLLIPTLGLSLFWYFAAELRYFAERTALDDLRFRYDVKGGQLLGVYLRYFLALAGALIVFGAAMVLVMQSSGQGFTPPQPGELMNPTLIAVPLILLLFVYMLLGVVKAAILTHGLAGLLCRTMTVSGSQDYAAIAQSRQSRPGRGEGLADALDIGGL